MPEPDHSAVILDSLQEGVVAFDADLRAVMANPFASRLLGWPVGWALGRPAAELFDGDPDIVTALRDSTTGRGTGPQTDVVRRRPDGTLQHLSFCPVAFPLEGGPGVVLVVRDVSASKRMEWEISQAEKMSALGRLAASVAHEVRNPLGAIDIQLQLLEEDLSGLPAGDRDHVYGRLRTAQAEMKRLDRIVGNFLRFSRAAPLDLSTLSLNDVVRHVFELVTPEAREQNVVLSLDLDPDLPPVDGDAHQLEQAVLNLTVNAFQAMEGGGQVCGRSWCDRRQGESYLELSDTGCGIPEEEMDRIFEYYHTTKDEGTGLGLSIAQQIIYQHGGNIEVETCEGSGTAFRIRIPSAGIQDPRHG